MKIRIANKEYEVQVAKTEEEKEQGLQGVNYLPDNEGMLFIYEEPQELSFWMEDTPLPLDVIFIDEDYEVISVHKGEPNSTTPMTEKDVLYVLELNQGSGVKPGDELELEDEEESSNKPNGKMLVLDENGETQMQLEGGERIFSRKNTKILIKLADKAYNSKNDKDYEKLGKKIFQFLDKQDSNTPEYVESPK